MKNRVSPLNPQDLIKDSVDKRNKKIQKDFGLHQHTISWETSILGFTAASHDHDHEEEEKEEKEDAESLSQRLSRSASQSVKRGYSSLKSNLPENGRVGIEEVEKAAKKIGQNLSDFADQLKTVDGIDETANLIGQILPAFEQAVATTTILSVFTPFVLLGVIGMTHEYQEAREQFAEIQHRQIDSEQKLYQLRDFAVKYQNMIAERFGIEIQHQKPENAHDQFLISNPLNQSNCNLTSLALTITEIIDQRTKFLISELGVKYGFTGIIGMSGMFAGMVAGIATSSIDIENILRPAAALEIASTASGIATSSLFMFGQTAMMIYATNRGRQGLIAQSHLTKTKETFENIAAKFSQSLTPETQKQVSEIISRQIKYIDKHSVEYAALTDIGQTAMITGTALGFFDFGTASIPLFAVGASTTIFAAINRITHQDREKNFFGHFSDEAPIVKNHINAINPASLITAKLSPKQITKNGKNLISWNEQEMHREIFSEISEVLEFHSEAIAEVKICSLLHHIVNDSRLFSSKRQKYQTIKKRLLDAAERIDNNHQEEDSPAFIEKPFQKTAEVFSPVASEFRGHGNYLDRFLFKGSGRSSMESAIIKKMRDKISEMESSSNIGGSQSFIDQVLSADNDQANQLIFHRVVDATTKLTGNDYQNNLNQFYQDLALDKKDYSESGDIDQKQVREIITAVKSATKECEV